MDRVRSISGRVGVAASSEQPVDWESAYRDLLPKVFRFFAYRIGDAQIAEDLASSTFERAWKVRRRYKSDLGAFEAWVFGIARNVAADHFRRLRPSRRLDQAIEDAADDPVEETVERKGDFERLSNLLAQLPPRERELVSLKYGGRLTNRAIARVTGLSESNVGTILYRVVSRLRDRWEGNP